MHLFIYHFSGRDICRNKDLCYVAKASFLIKSNNGSVFRTIVEPKCRIPAYKTHYRQIKGVSTRPPSPVSGSISGEKAYKQVIRAHEKFGSKRTNRLKVMVKNSKNNFDYGF